MKICSLRRLIKATANARHDFSFLSSMTEEIQINGQKVYILIEPHTHPGHPDGSGTEYFTAAYTVDNTRTEPSAVLFLNDDKTPKCFESPVQALEYANEKLLGLI